MYGFQSFHFPGQAGADNINSQVCTVLYGHRVSGRMDLVFGVGPQWTRIDGSADGNQFPLVWQRTSLVALPVSQSDAIAQL